MCKLIYRINMLSVSSVICSQELKEFQEERDQQSREVWESFHGVVVFPFSILGFKIRGLQSFCIWERKIMVKVKMSP